MSHVVRGVLVAMAGMVLPVEVLGAHVGPVLCHNSAVVLHCASSICISRPSYTSFVQQHSSTVFPKASPHWHERKFQTTSAGIQPPLLVHNRMCQQP